jgi:hypothetical protein
MRKPDKLVLIVATRRELIVTALLLVALFFVLGVTGA